MINLIPNQEKKKMIKGFYYRLTILSLLMLSVSIFIAILSLMPAYFFSSSRNNIANQKLEIQKKELLPLVDQQTSVIINDINKKLTLVEKAEKNKYSVSERVINAIFLKKISSIKITQITYQNNLLDGKKINISGTAPSREVLLLFRQALEEDPSFKSVNLPISNFVKGSDIQFYLSLIPV
ncbi:MAG: hypothetical protein KGL67_00775 [Patescibacteria group bacterium]|nr:hypothetical protein [Patescibacteria group bacterium]